MHGCRSCGGAWADVATLKVLLAAAAAEAAATGDTPQPSNIHQRRLGGTAVVYRRCAVCGDHMHRRNFARVSGVIVDECRVHGTFFDAGELEDVLDFVRSGGLAVAARRDAEEHARQLKQRHAVPPPMSMGANSGWSPDPWDAPEVDALGAFVSWAGRWVRNAFR
jgi:Zn-finger nucleic acid-binding protein